GTSNALAAPCQRRNTHLVRTWTPTRVPVNVRCRSGTDLQPRKLKVRNQSEPARGSGFKHFLVLMALQDRQPTLSFPEPQAGHGPGQTPTPQQINICSYSPSNITILDRKALEAAACSCYEVVKHMHDGA